MKKMFKELFSAERRREKATKKATDRLTNKYRQTPERMGAAQTLQEIGTDEAIYGLLKRFTITSSNTVVDEEEKEHVYHMVLGFGQRAVPVLKKFISREVQILWPLKALSGVLPPEEVVESLGQILGDIGPDYIRNPERKLHLVQHLADYQLPSVVDILLPFLQDHDETIRFQVINALSRHDDERVREGLLDLYQDEEEDSLRIKHRILEVFAEKRWTVRGYRKKVEEGLPSGFVLDREGHITRRG